MANPKAADVVNQAKLYANDKDGTKYQPETYLLHTNTAIQKLYQRHPSAFYVTAILTDDPPAVVGLDEDIAVLPQFVDPMASYVAARCLVEGAGGNDEFNAKLAKQHMDAFDAA